MEGYTGKSNYQYLFENRIGKKNKKQSFSAAIK
jgi:hypothetical protein